MVKYLGPDLGRLREGKRPCRRPAYMQPSRPRAVYLAGYMEGLFLGNTTIRRALDRVLASFSEEWYGYSEYWQQTPPWPWTNR